MVGVRKPWENESSVNNLASSSALSHYVPNNQEGAPMSTPAGGSGQANIDGINSNIPPPVPPRPAMSGGSSGGFEYGRNLGYGSYGSMPGIGNSYGYGGYGGVYGSAVNPYYNGRYGNLYGYGNYGLGTCGGSFGPHSPYGDERYTSISQIAEERSASAFQSIESFVNAFGSITYMMESTLRALYSSFRAVVGVADHMGRLKQILSTLAIFKFFKWVYKRILYLVGISKIKPQNIENLWRHLQQNAEPRTVEESILGVNGKPSTWPIVVFLGFIFAGPYVIWKLMASLNKHRIGAERHEVWAKGIGEHFVASAQYDFVGGNETELTVRKGQVIRVAPSDVQPTNMSRWVLASDGSRIGLVPANYLAFKGKNMGSGGSTSKLELESSSAPHFKPPQSNLAQSSKGTSTSGSTHKIKSSLTPSVSTIPEEDVLENRTDIK